MMWTYTVALLVAITGMALLDYRYKLAWWKSRRRTMVTLGVALSVFVAWDALGIALGIFIHGNSRWSLPFTIAPQFPLEELLFLTLLIYCTLVTYNGIRQWRSRI